MKIKKAVIAAAGLGTRFLPITKAVPKPMLPVFDKPTIQYIMEEIKSAGIEKTAIIVSGDCPVIKNHFSEAKVLEENLKQTGKKDLYDIAMATRDFGEIEFIIQPTPNGLAGALLCAEDFIAGEPFALLLGDEIYANKDGDKSCLKKLIDEYEKTGVSQIAAMEVFGDDISKYGNFAVNEKSGYNAVYDIIEKPSLSDALSNLAAMGRYALSSEIFTFIKELFKTQTKGEVYLTDALKDMANSIGLYACPFNDARYDIGDKVGYIKANIEYSLKNEKVSSEIKEYLKELLETL
ncbi:MAG: UTP--glucose-1-phosphate uridylyltransferase [Clostridia bacterium]|nr:UTP--glucose-1-phosphate uridylyltransferase [Clostridia bacterium]